MIAARWVANVKSTPLGIAGQLLVREKVNHALLDRLVRGILGRRDAEMADQRSRGAAVRGHHRVAVQRRVPFADTACDLLSTDEAAAILAKGPLSATPNQFAPQFCPYAIVATGEVVLSTYFQPKGGAATFAGIQGTATTDPVSGLGDKAMFEPGSGILYVLKGDTLLNANLFGQGPTETLAQDTKLVEVMLSHL